MPVTLVGRPGRSQCELPLGQESTRNCSEPPDNSVGRRPTKGATVVTAADGSYHWNPANPYDVNQDGRVTPLDVLLVINAINAAGAQRLSGINPKPYRVDVSGDQRLSALDAVLSDLEL